MATEHRDYLANGMIRLSYVHAGCVYLEVLFDNNEFKVSL